MKIVIDTSPFISLAVLDHLELLKKLFPTIIVPQAVYQEIKAAGEKEEYIKIANFIENRIYHPKEDLSAPGPFFLSKLTAQFKIIFLMALKIKISIRTSV